MPVDAYARMRIDGLTAASSRVLAKSGVAVSNTGSTSEFTFATITIPANAIGPNGQVEIIALWSYTNSANAKTVRNRFGGTQINSITATTTANIQSYIRLGNRNAANSQFVSGQGSAGGGFGSSATALGTAAIDTTAAVDITLTGQLASAAETITLESYLVRISYGA